MRPDDNSCSVLGATNFTWLKDYMQPLRERFESDIGGYVTRSELCELMRENQRLNQLVAELSHGDSLVPASSGGRFP